MSSQRGGWRERLHANPPRMEQELALGLQDNGISYQTQVEIPVTTADFYFPIEPRPLIVFVDGRVHLKTSQTTKDEETRTLQRKKGYRTLEPQYNGYSVARNWVKEFETAFTDAHKQYQETQRK
jgi:very-short-patch-repair endonuclease